MTEIINKFGRKIEVNSPSDFLIEYDYLSEHEIDRKWYRQGIEYLINASPVYYDEQLDDFLRHTIPDNKNRHDTVYYLLIIPEKEEKIIFSFHNFEEYLFYLQQAAYLSEKERWNTYFYPTYFLEMNKCFSLNEKSATVFKSFVIDVDNIDITPTDINDTKALQTVLRQHNLDSFPCNYCLLSGHGIHLYSMLKIDIQPNERKTLMKSLATKYKGDLAVVPSAHAFRIPTSYNIKPDEKAAKSKLFVLNKEPFDISALKSITNTVSDEMVLAYQTACNKDKNGKRLLTQRTNKLNDLITKEMKNGLSEEEKVLKTLLVELKDSGTLDVSAELFKEMKKNRGIKAYTGNQSKIEPIKMPSTEPIIIENDSPSTKKDCHNNECRKVDATQWDYVQIKQIGKKLIAVNVLNELSNYLKRHQGIHLHRRCFCLIYGNYAKLIMPMDDCLKKIRVFMVQSHFLW